MAEVITTNTGNEIATRIGFVAKESSLSNWPTTGEKFIIDAELKAMGQFLIKKYRTDLQHSNIEYVFKEKASKKGDTVNHGTAKTESDLQKTLHHLDAVIVMGWDEWCALDTDNKLRVLYHEIEKLTFDDKSGKLVTINPTVMQFPSVLQVFGPSSNAEIEFIAAYNKFVKNNGGL